ncbi:MAG: tRNA 2-thiouridine(34) synthase MnmA [Patescibacteria group bacterium]|nr:tRNA 2-thiouridine(34) synthase MnmA [Patescibacteria group bacterium]
MFNKNKKVALGLSGGVDSAVSAQRLLEQGYDVTAVFIQCWDQPGCRTELDRQDALKIALKLDIPFKVLDFCQQYRKQILDYFLQSYKKGVTPNPDVLCNQVIKFGLFYDWALENRFNHVATGHYARIIANKNKKANFLATSKDNHKDQTYFLHQLRKKQLDHILFPVGDLTKKEVRKKAREKQLHVADKKDSVGICFVGNIDVRQFLKNKIGEKKGEVTTQSGEIIGSHSGVWLYTIGQRKGFSINKKWVEKRTDLITKKQDLPPFYVIDKSIKKNQLIVGVEKDIAKKKFTISKLHLINKNTDLLFLPLKVRIRHTGKLVDCKVNKVKKDEFCISLSQPLKGIAPGQFAVFYTRTKNLVTNESLSKYICLGGATISR